MTDKEVATTGDEAPLLLASSPEARQQVLFWNQMTQIKIGAEYIKAYRERVAQRIWYFDIVKAVASSGAVGAWAVFQAYPMVWGGVIAASQLAEVVKGTLPLAKVHEGAARLSVGLDALFIEAQFEWDRIAAGKLTEDEISKARRRIMMTEHELQSKHFPDGLKRRADLMKVAEAESATYFETMFGAGRLQ